MIATKVITGAPGSTWTNTTNQIWYQLIVKWIRSCGRCIQYDHQISPWWNVPFHPGCRCENRPIYPGQTASPYIDFREEIDKLPPTERNRVVGASNLRLIETGIAKWEDVVTRTRVRAAHEVVDLLQVSRDAMIQAGIPSFRADAILANTTPTGVRAIKQDLLTKLTVADPTGRGKLDAAKKIAGRASVKRATPPPPPAPPPSPPPLPPAPVPPPPPPTGLVPPGPIQDRIQQYLAETGDARIQHIQSTIKAEADALEKAQWDLNAKTDLLVTVKTQGAALGMSPTAIASQEATLQAEIAVLKADQAKAQIALTRAVIRSLELPTPGTQVNLAYKTSNASIKNGVDTVKGFLEKIVKDAIVNVEVIRRPGSNSRAFARYVTTTNSQIHLTANDGSMTTFHEMGHCLEFQHWGQIAKDFLDYRTQGETPQLLRAKFGNRYRPHETAKGDKFEVVPGGLAESSNWYVGKIYSNSIPTTEITSMGIEHLLRNPRQFLKDREYTGLILGLLDGRLR